jgi:hypothetical protein
MPQNSSSGSDVYTLVIIWVGGVTKGQCYAQRPPLLDGCSSATWAGSRSQQYEPASSPFDDRDQTVVASGTVTISTGPLANTYAITRARPASTLPPSYPPSRLFQNGRSLSGGGCLPR